MINVNETNWWQNNRIHLLAGYRIKHNISQKELAEKSGISQALISQYENGKRKISMKTAKKIADVLHENPQKLINSFIKFPNSDNTTEPYRQ